MSVAMPRQIMQTMANLIHFEFGLTIFRLFFNDNRIPLWVRPIRISKGRDAAPFAAAAALRE